MGQCTPQVHRRQGGDVAPPSSFIRFIPWIARRAAVAAGVRARDLASIDSLESVATSRSSGSGATRGIGNCSSFGRPKISDIVPNGCQISSMLNVGKLLLCRLALFETIDA
jgi:hypothetical protein